MIGPGPTNDAVHLARHRRLKLLLRHGIVYYGGQHGRPASPASTSPVALERAQELASRCEVAVDYIEADSTRLPDHLSGRFDLTYATIGIICWIADLEAWMTSVSATLRPYRAYRTPVRIDAAAVMVWKRFPEWASHAANWLVHPDGSAWNPVGPQLVESGRSVGEHRLQRWAATFFSPSAPISPGAFVGVHAQFAA